MGVIYKGETDLARTLMETQCNIDETNNAGETALAFAAPQLSLNQFGLDGRLSLVPLLPIAAALVLWARSAAAAASGQPRPEEALR